MNVRVTLPTIEFATPERSNESDVPVPPAVLTDSCQVLTWPCAFLGCPALRVFEGGRAGFNLPACHCCGSAIATSAAERETIRQSVIYLI
jgi:hypothetical protein